MLCNLCPIPFHHYGNKICFNQSFSHVYVPFIVTTQKSILFCDNPFRDKGVIGNVIYMPR